MMEGKGDVVTGLKNKLSTMAAAVTPSVCWQKSTAKWLSPVAQRNDAIARITSNPPLVVSKREQSYRPPVDRRAHCEPLSFAVSLWQRRAGF